MWPDHALAANQPPALRWQAWPLTGRICVVRRLNAIRYTLYSVPFAVILLVLAISGSWHVFGLVVSLMLGLLCVYVRWFRGQRNVWPFAMKIINWDVVQKLSEDEPSA